MSVANEDLQALLKSVEEWAARVPSKAEEFHRRRNALAQQIREAAPGFGSSRDQGQTAEIVRKAREMEADVPAIASMAAVASRVRNTVIEFQAAPAHDRKTGALVVEWCNDWVSLIDFLLTRTSDRRSAEKAIAQMTQIESWANDRRNALGILSGIAGLHQDDTSPGLKAALDNAVRYWTEDFAAQRTDSRWLAGAGSTARRLTAEWEAERSKAAPNPVPAAPAGRQENPQQIPPEKTPEKPPERPSTPAPQRNQWPDPPPVNISPAGAEQPVPTSGTQSAAALPPAGGPPQAPSQAAAAAPAPQSNPGAAGSSTSMPFWEINQMLAESNALAEALHHSRGEIEKLELRYWQLFNQPVFSPQDAEALQQEIQRHRDGLQVRSNEEVERRLRRLRSRWNWFRVVYGERPDIAVKIRAAESSKPDEAIGLREFAQLVDDAEQLIHAIANAHRPKLAKQVESMAARCQSEIGELLAKPCLSTTEAALKALVIPAAPDVQVNADQLFERLEQGEAALARIAALRETNANKEKEALALAAHLNRLQLQLAASNGGPPAPPASAGIPAGRFIDDFERDLKIASAELEAQIAAARERDAGILVKLRKENAAWIRVLAPYVPEVEGLTGTAPPPSELDQLTAAIALERQYEKRISDLKGRAAEELERKRKDAAARLERHLSSPAFETHPDRETAGELMQRLQTLETAKEPCSRQAFRSMEEAVEDAEDFLARIEAAQRRIPEQLALIEESFARLRELNAVVYRQGLARRINTLILGVKRGIQLEQWEPLDAQLKSIGVLLSALERDALRRISAETEDLAGKLEAIAKDSKDAVLVRQIQSALEELRELGPFQPPPYSIRQRMARLERRAPRR
jgi:hypothetical protein